MTRTIQIDLTAPDEGAFLMDHAGLKIEAWRNLPDPAYDDPGGWQWLVRVIPGHPLRGAHGGFQSAGGPAEDRSSAIRLAQTKSIELLDAALSWFGVVS